MKNPFGVKRGFSFAIILAGLCAPLISPAGGFVAAWGDNNLGQCRVPNGLINIKAIDAGNDHNLALRANGTVVAWGSNIYGQTNIPSALTGIAAISAGSYHNVALKKDGTLVAWGRNLEGQTHVPSGLSNVIAVAAGGGHNVALKVDGTVIAWGNNYIGLTNVPVGLSNVIAIAAGGLHNIALKSDGHVVAWGGANIYGEINVPAGLSNVIAIAAGGNHNLALKADGTVAAWGYAEQGQINVPTGLSNVVKIADGTYQSLVIKADGSVVAWGLDDRAVANIPAGMSNVTALAGGNTHSIALVFSGPVQIVEEPQSQNIAYTSNVTFSVVATGAETISYQWLRNGTVLTDEPRYSGRTNATLTISNAQFSDAGTYTVVVSNAFGSVMSTGAVLTVIGPPIISQQPANRTVPAGTNLSLTVIASGTPVLQYQWNFNGTNIPGATGASLTFINVQPSASGSYFVQITNLYGSAQTIPVTLTVTNSAPYILSHPKNRTAFLGDSASFTISARGSLPLSYQWRFNGTEIPNATNATLTLTNLQYNQTGFYTVGISNAFGQTNSAKAFLNVPQLHVWGTAFEGNTNMPAGLTNVIAVAAGGSHIMALKQDGTVKVWMANSGYISGPTLVTNVPASVTNVIAISAGRDHALALRSNGTVVAWGGYSSGQTNVPAGLSNVISVAAGLSRSYAVKSDGTVVMWGAFFPTPTNVSSVVKISSAASQNLALKRDGSVIGWGYSGIPDYLTNVSGLSNAMDIAAGSGGNLALRKDGTVWSSLNSRILLPTNLFNGVAIAVGNSTSMALKDDGTVTSSGSFGSTKIPMLSNVTAIAIGGVQADFGVALFGNGAPVITLQPYSQNVSKSDFVQLHARAVGAQPMSYQWQLENQNIPGATNASLAITNMMGKHTGSYRMLASNALGSTFSATANLTIPFSINLPAALNATNLVWESFSSTSKTVNVWFAQIRETHDNDAAAQSGGISYNEQSQLNTTVVGPGTLTFWWKVSSEAGYDHLRFHMDSQGIPHAMISGEIGWEKKTFSIPSGNHVLRWTYTKDGTVSSGRDAGWVDEVVFTSLLPKFIRHPFDQTVEVGANVTIPAIAESSTPMSYQWLKNGTNLSGATAQYLTLTNVTLKDSATYALKVSNLYGNVTSSNAVLTVIAPKQLQPMEFLPDGSALLFSRDTNGGTFEIQASTNVKDWITLPITPILTNGSLMFHDTNCQNFPMRFYRIVEH